MKVTKELVHITYDIAKEVYEGKISRKEGVEIIVGDGRMNPNSVADFIHNLKCLLDGKKFTRTNNTYSMEYFFEKIYKDYGIKGLSNALRALNLHIKYYEGYQDVTMHSMRKIYSKYLKIYVDNPDQDEQQEITTILQKENKTKLQLAQELKNLKPTDPEFIVINSKSYKRDNVTIAKIKELRDYKCQICSHSIKKKDGSYYIEAAHIEPKHLGGNELPNNIILLCPNHHKEFDYGETKIIERTYEFVKFELNGKIHTITLKIDL
ncbi:5-methylcytosine-specific restriction protein A [Aquimarina sp. MAR_2010_214]|uniref:HNH endonuclease n=1 Tax=Aquimarina sp. MAR_2010_214 TaxID=1250026 RepID=UPI000C70B4AB|nr:HNH endonuclease [Aquimarina sp. MAR_2010_214]PKV51907.1 5-methylcytosine-specific restriction protein A [Aquimarina sp. MAR_2010_214]